jgi:hypothetical protein
MHDAGGVRGGERRSHLNGRGERFFEAHPSAPYALAQRFALDMLHGDEVAAVCRFVDIVDDADVRMRERCGGARLPLEAA